MGISIRQVKGLQEALDNKAQRQTVEALIERIETLENKLNLLTDNGKITTINLIEEETQ